MSSRALRDEAIVATALFRRAGSAPIERARLFWPQRLRAAGRAAHDEASRNTSAAMASRRNTIARPNE